MISKIRKRTNACECTCAYFI